MSALLESTLTRWRHRETGEVLVAVVVKRDEEATIVLPIEHDGVHVIQPHPLDWMPEASFLREYEVVA